MGSLSFYHKTERPWPHLRLDSGGIVGHTTATTARIWVRAKHAGQYRLTLLPGRRIERDFRVHRSRQGFRVFQDGADGTATISPAHVVELELSGAKDFTGVAQVEGLEPNTRYYYALYCVGEPHEWPWEFGITEPCSFVTAETAPEKVSFGLYSCHMPYTSSVWNRTPRLVNEDMWEAFYTELRNTHADFVVGAGDQVYTDGHGKLNIWKWLQKIRDQNPTDEDMLSWYRDIYRGYWGVKALQNVYRNFPQYMTWDDHEIMDGWGSYTPEELSNQLDSIWRWENQDENLALAGRMFQAARTVYQEYQHSHNPPSPEGQLDYSFSRGPCAFYVLDCRGHRDLSAPEGRKILGAEQMQRFKNWLNADDTAQVLFVVNSVPVVHTSNFIVNWLDIPVTDLKDDVRDHWESERHSLERDEFLRAIFKASHESKRRIILLSGDVHVAASFRLACSEYKQARVFQLTSSGISYAALSGIARQALSWTTRKRGQLKPRTGGPIFEFERLQVLVQNNFALLHIQPDPTHAHQLEVAWDLYAKAEAPGAVHRLERVLLE